MATGNSSPEESWGRGSCTIWQPIEVNLKTWREHPERVTELGGAWDAWAAPIGVVPLTPYWPDEEDQGKPPEKQGAAELRQPCVAMNYRQGHQSSHPLGPSTRFICGSAANLRQSARETWV